MIHAVAPITMTTACGFNRLGFYSMMHMHIVVSAVMSYLSITQY